MLRNRQLRIVSSAALIVGLAAAAHAATVTLTPTKDNTLYESATGALSSGAGPHLLVGRTGQASFSRRRALLAFDVAGSVPAGATITGASLSMHVSQTGAGPKSVELRRAVADWGEGTSDASANPGGGVAAQAGDATWIHTFSATTFWTTAGGDFTATASASTMVSGVGSYGWSSSGMAADVQSWLDQPAANFGWLVLGDESSSGTSKRFDSRQNSEADVRPMLTVEYSLPAVPADSRSTRILVGLLLAGGLGFAVWRRAVSTGH